jgi:hypothetical protein
MAKVTYIRCLTLKVVAGTVGCAVRGLTSLASCTVSIYCCPGKGVGEAADSVGEAVGEVGDVCVTKRPAASVVGALFRGVKLMDMK